MSLERNPSNSLSPPPSRGRAREGVEAGYLTDSNPSRSFPLQGGRSGFGSNEQSGFNKILVVDDSAANLQLLLNLLTEQGYSVYPASDGGLALEFVQTTLPDLILLDIKMPGMDGYEVCRRLKADARSAAIPVIFLSALEDQHDKVKGFQAGGVDYITKPFQPDEMLARVRMHMRMRELTEGLEQEVCARTEDLMVANKQLEAEIAERRQAEETLRKRNEELERFERLVVGRELTMIELKKRVTQLNEALVNVSEKKNES